jgi:tRNA(Ile)-lysidine synthase TilS/MesJ
MGEGLEPYVLNNRHFDILRQSAEKEQGFYNVHPLAFLEYNEKKMLASINKLGWTPPTDTDSNSSNCLLNTFANQAHLDRYKFHPYAMENAGLVRDGHLEREEALERLNQPMDQTLSQYIMKTLKIT